MLALLLEALLFAALALFAVNALSSPGEAAGDCTADPALDTEEQAFLVLINNHRAQNGLPPLAASYTLSKSAQWKSQDMANNNYFAHDDLTRTWVTRIRDCGYGYNTWLGENIAAGFSGAGDMLAAWQASPFHNENLLRPEFQVVGLACAFNQRTRFHWFWTADFGGQPDTE